MAHRFYKVTLRKRGRFYTSWNTTGVNKKDVISKFTNRGKNSYKKGNLVIKQIKSLY